MPSDAERPKRVLSGSQLAAHSQERRATDWLARVWERPNTGVLMLAQGKAPVTNVAQQSEGEIADYELHLHFSAPQGELPGQAVYLGEVVAEDTLESAEEHPIRHVVAVPATTPPAGPPGALDQTSLSWEDLRRVGHQLPAVEAKLLTHAAALTGWHASAAFCPGCGGVTEPRSSGWARSCMNCDAEHFPRTDPAVITAVTDADDRLLLGSAVLWDVRRYSTFAGFVEAGESLEDAVVREVKEEAGVTVDRVEYVSSQAWPFPRSLMIGFFGRTRDVEAAADLEEIREVRWFTRQELHDCVSRGSITLPARSSISRGLIERWYGGPLERPGAHR
ncbi:NAD(+) diphosphatase [Nesterenkonia alkaliphila]|uniref:NAD(+) diphosphatase n=1 Tax=Nesterenkonia alkaliphila TaxID=1463631 RepID=A0A7K1UH44_9MICC|nr:NAD(+) diphosphatase [Nesterenkonia alkaliphila]MVT25759.1 NAD(+) diphosphatase [Nesterenkonia alkaliphila]GFZ93071.1 hypothetical protein GCM10011359_23080 [Nesterenkonia alkaliphila]